MSSHKGRINVARIVERSRVNGPGERAVVWVQGCSLRCRGCINPLMQENVVKRLMTPDELAEKILGVEGIEGVSFTGGEPFEQAEGLFQLSRRLREARLSVLSYSGYTYEELSGSRDPFVRNLLASLDILIDGRFEMDKAAPLRWRGSRNQRIILLSERYRGILDMSEDEMKELEIEVGGGRIHINGNLDWELLATLGDILSEEYGVITRIRGKA